MKNQATREEVYAVVDGERDYQDSLSPTSETEGFHTVAEWALYIGSYANDLQQLLSHTWGPNASIGGLEIIRKITAMGVACMEQNGTVERSEAWKVVPR
jgi:hypothetical protein